MRSIWAVAVNTIRQALRMKLVIAFTVMLLVLLPVIGATMTGDGTLKGRLQTFVSYGLSLTSFLLCLLTIIISIYSLTSDIEQRQIYTVITKPIRRFELLLGKLLGVVLLNTVLLILFSAMIYFITIYMPRFSGASPAEIELAKSEFFTARASLMPSAADVRKEVAETYNKLEKSGQLPTEVPANNIMAWLTNQKRLEKQAAAVGHDLLWEFYNVKPLDANQDLFVRFKYDVAVNPADLHILGRWEIGDDRQIRYGSKTETPIYRFDRKDLIRTFYEIKVSADAIAKDGYLAVRFINVPANNTTVIFPLNDGLEVLYNCDTFAANFVRAVILILLRLIFLACLGIFAASFLSFPVAVLLCLAVFFTGTISGFIFESFGALSGNVSWIYLYTVKPIFQLVPQFDKFSPAQFLVPARLLSWSLLAKAAVFMVCIKAVFLFLMAILIFSYREIAKVII
ncbi:MAG: hypothetical protein KAI59_05605 [Planctomycetes bacterium]|nr:hypothetical protein [Planctomycetota bacterium]